jgi:hypothetical protein
MTASQSTAPFDSARHEPLHRLAWDEARAQSAIERIVADAEAHFSADTYWPAHPCDHDDGEPATLADTPLYHGASGVFWALDYLGASGDAAAAARRVPDLHRLLARNRAWLGASASRERASFLMGDTPIELMAYGVHPSDSRDRVLAALIEGNVEHPSRELMWGAPGTMLAALFLHERTGHARWADLYRLTARALWRDLAWSDVHRCAYWTQDLYGRRSTYLGAVHGFVATALPLIRGRHLMEGAEWNAWERCIVETVRRTADRRGSQVNWPPHVDAASDAPKRLLQFCHGAPGFVVCLAELPTSPLDDLLVAAGETIWSAGPLTKGANLCHGTGGNGYAFLKLYRRTGDAQWLERARAFAMHGIVQTDEARKRYGQGRYSLWTGDLGFAIYLRDCIRAQAHFPTLDVFYSARR